jgi:chromosome segregation ATPase
MIDCIRIPELQIETDGDLIYLEQDSGGNIDRVAIHRLHVRHMAEKFGLVETADLQAAKTIAKLERRLRLLRDRIDHLGNWLTNVSDREHADLDYEITYIEATSDLADEFCADMEGQT